jgi:GDP-L-fucose synthase
MKVAILGANGFIGSYLSSYFWTKKYQVLPITRQVLDLTDTSAVTKWCSTHSPTIVINCAVAGGGVNVNERNIDVLEQNLKIFFNFYSLSNKSNQFRFINIGSGAEFDKSQDITTASEHHLCYCMPGDSYGLSKNIIARAVLEKKNFFTLRLFGCFGSFEPQNRLFKKFLSGNLQQLQNRYFDYFFIRDFARVVEYYCKQKEQDLPKDMNCVYNEKYQLVDILHMLKKIKKIDMPINESKNLYNSYTGNSYILQKLMRKENFPKLDGLYKGLESYE